MTAFQRLISKIPKDVSVLDVGAGGLDGENTTSYLIERFGKKNLACISTNPSPLFLQLNPDANLWKADFYALEPEDREFDLAVLDLNIENNLLDWSSERLAGMRRWLSDDGHLINYVMTTDKYGDEKTPATIRKHWLDFWGGVPTPEAVSERLQSIPGYEFVAVEREERRPEILWVMLKKISGL